MKKEKRKKKLPLLARDANNFNQTERKKKSKPPISSSLAFIRTDARLVCNQEKN